VSRRKQVQREMLRHKERRIRLLMGAALLIFLCFGERNISYWRSVRNYHSTNTIQMKGSFYPSIPDNPIAPNSADTNNNPPGQDLRGGDNTHKIWIDLERAQPFNDKDLARKAKRLIVVAGHSVTVSGHLEDAGSDESDWFLLSYQKGQGLPQAIHAHIQAGIEQAHKDPSALLIFSGGETRAISGPQTEAQAYYHVADAMNLWQGSVRARTATEEFATDSFENLMFALCRFREVTGDYPQKIAVISFSFKRRRFETLHAPALQWPPDHFLYIGVDPPASTGFDLRRATEGEIQNAAAPFEKDPYGCHTPVLQEKRKSRNPFMRTPPYALTCPEMSDLLSYCGPQLYPAGRLPWGKQQ
jgi:hypothetical protein